MIINKFNKWFENNSGRIPRHLARPLLQLNNLKEFCLNFPTYDKCPFQEKHVGCLFRGKTPREW